MTPIGFALAATLGLVSSAAMAATAGPPAVIDYMTAPFKTERLLDWGTRPDWSPDGKRIAFTQSEFRDSHAYQLDLATREVRCLTCHLGMNGLVTRIYHLPDGSFLLLAPRNLSGAQMRRKASTLSDPRDEELYWMPANAKAAPQPLGAPAFGEIAISSKPTSAGVQIAWGSTEGRRSKINLAILNHDGRSATLVDTRMIYDAAKADKRLPVTATETYGFSRNGKAIYFWTIVPGASLDGEMYEVDIATGALRPMYRDPSHNETHLFADERFGLEESNRSSDPMGAWRGVSSIDGKVVAMMAKASGETTLTPEEIANYAPTEHLRGFNRPFDIYAIRMDGLMPPRQLTDFSRFGANAGQSAPSPDGRRIVFAIDERGSSNVAGASGLYIGEFTASKAGQ